MTIRHLLLFAGMGLAVCTSARAEVAGTALSSSDSSNTALPAATPIFDAIVVSGNQPGPGLWKVSKDDAHVMWVLGTLTPVPKKMIWQSADVEAVIAQSQEVLFDGGISVSSGKGFFGTLFLMPSLLGMRKNPDEEVLRDVVPADLYLRWLALKQKYLGRNQAVEKRRPIFAAYELYEKAIDKSGLSNAGIVAKLVRKTAKRHKITITQPLVKIKLEDPKGMIKSFKKTQLADVECFAKTLQHLESDLETMKDRANAWATGDVELLQELTYTDQGRACIDAVLEAGAFAGEGFADLPERVKKEWLTAAEAALAKNARTFSVLPMHELVDADGFLAALRQRGYRVEAPGAEAEPL